MRRPHALLLAVSLALAAALVFQRAEVGARPTGAPPPVRVWRSDCAGKPLAHLGEVRASVVERPLSDEAVIRADWRRGPLGEGCRLALILPEGATLLEGEFDQALPEGLAAGVSTFRVRFSTRCTSDLTLRLCATVEGALCSRDTYVRLWECHEER